jgi:uncharacterized protein YlaI
METNCGKIGYTQHAVDEARRAIYKQRDVKLRTYLCPDCYMWHLTSNMDKNSKGKVTINKKTWGRHNKYPL